MWCTASLRGYDMSVEIEISPSLFKCLTLQTFKTKDAIHRSSMAMMGWMHVCWKEKLSEIHEVYGFKQLQLHKSRVKCITGRVYTRSRHVKRITCNIITFSKITRFFWYWLLQFAARINISIFSPSVKARSLANLNIFILVLIYRCT